MLKKYSQSLSKLVGKSSKEIVVWLAKRHPEIRDFSFVFYRQRVKKPHDIDEKIKSGPNERFLRISRDEILPGKLDHLLDKNSDFSLGLNSNIALKNNKNGQIPMVGFNCQIEKKNMKLIIKLIKTINQSGFLIISGKSYHFIGREIIVDDQERWRKFLGKCLLSSLVNPRYIGHALDRGFSTLRISIYKNYLSLPKIIDVIV